MSKFTETGESGLKQTDGWISEAYNTKLEWPSVQPLYNKIRRSDPEISQVRHMFVALSRGVDFQWELPEDASDDDKKAQEFAEQVMEDLDGGPGALLETIVSQVPFMGWGWWDAPPCIRKPDWKPPEGDPWRSEFDDGLIGFRRLAWRDTSSFYKWEFDSHERVTAMIQRPYNKFYEEKRIPLNRSLHLTFGDTNNPEGLSPLESVWRLDRIKYGLELIQGIGFEHSAGYLSTSVDGHITPEIKAAIREAARNVATAQEGNYLIWPKDVTGELISTPFAAGPAILEAIKYYGILKLAVYNMQWAAMSTTSGTGSYSAHQDSTEMFMTFYNAMMEGFAKQIDNQIGKRLFEINKDAFPGITNRPRLTITPIRKSVALDAMSQFLRVAYDIGLLQSDDDWAAIRKQIKFMPETPSGNEGEMPAEPNKKDDTEAEDEKKVEKVEKRDMARRPFVVDDDEHPDLDDSVKPLTLNEVEKGIAKLKRRAKRLEDPRDRAKLEDFIAMLEAEPYPHKDNE